MKRSARQTQAVVPTADRRPSPCSPEFAGGAIALRTRLGLHLAMSWPNATSPNPKRQPASRAHLHRRGGRSNYRWPRRPGPGWACRLRLPGDTPHSACCVAPGGTLRDCVSAWFARNISDTAIKRTRNACFGIAEFSVEQPTNDTHQRVVALLGGELFQVMPAGGGTHLLHLR